MDIDGDSPPVDTPHQPACSTRVRAVQGRHHRCDGGGLLTRRRNDLNEPFKKTLKAKVDDEVKPAEAPKADAGTGITPAAGTGVAKADAKPPTREEAVKKLLKGNEVLLACVQANGESHGFFELPEDLVVALHGQDLIWGVTFSNVDLHHFEMK